MSAPTSSCTCSVDFQTLAPQKPFQFRISTTLFSKKSNNGYHTKKIHMLDTSTLTFLRTKNVLVDCATACEMSASLFLCQTCQPSNTNNNADLDDTSLTSSKAPAGKGFHAFTRYMLSNDACGLCRIEIGEGKGSFAREIFASRSRLVYDGILVANGLNYVTIYLFPIEASIRKTLWQPIRSPLPETATTQQDSATQKSKGKRAIQLVRQESQSTANHHTATSASAGALAASSSSSNLRQLQRIPPGGRSFLLGVSEHSNIHARDLSLLHQTEESNHPYSIEMPPLQSADSMLLVNDNNNSRLEYTASDYYQDSNISRPYQPNNNTAAGTAPETRASFAHVFRKPSPALVLDEATRTTPNVSRKSSEKSDIEQPLQHNSSSSNNSSIIHGKKTSTLSNNTVIFTAAGESRMSPPMSLPAHTTGFDSGVIVGYTPAGSNVTKSPFAHLLLDSRKEEYNNDDNRTESTMDDDEMRRLVMQCEDSNMPPDNHSHSNTNTSLQNNSNQSKSIAIASYMKASSSTAAAAIIGEHTALVSSLAPEDEGVTTKAGAEIATDTAGAPEETMTIGVLSTVEKKVKGLPYQLQVILHRIIERQEVTAVQGVENFMQYIFGAQATSNATASNNKKKTKTAVSAKKDASTTSASVEIFQKVLSILAVVHKGRLGADGDVIVKICRVCLLEIYLLFAAGQRLLSDKQVAKIEKASVRKIIASTISAALSRLNLAVGSPSITQPQIFAAFEGVFPKNISFILQSQQLHQSNLHHTHQQNQHDHKNNTNFDDISTMLGTPSLSSHVVMQLLVNDLKEKYPQSTEATSAVVTESNYSEIWKIVGEEVNVYDAAMKSLSPSPQKMPVSLASTIMEPLHQQQQQPPQQQQASLNQALFDLGEESSAVMAAENAVGKGTITTIASSSTANTSYTTTNNNGPSLLKRTNTLIGDRQRSLGYHTNRRQKTIMVMSTAQATATAVPIASNNNNYSSSSSINVNLSNISMNTNNGVNGNSGPLGNGRLPLSRSSSTVSQLQQSFQSAQFSSSAAATVETLGSGVVVGGGRGALQSGSLLHAVVNQAAANNYQHYHNNQGTNTTSNRSSNSNSTIALGGIASKLRAASMAAGVKVASSSAAVTSTSTDSMNTTANNRIPKRTRSLQPQPQPQLLLLSTEKRKHLLTSPSPKRRRITSATQVNSNNSNVSSDLSSIMTPVLQHQHSSQHLLDIHDPSFHSPITSKVMSGNDYDDHHHQSKNSDTTQNMMLQETAESHCTPQQNITQLNGISMKPQQLALSSPISSLRSSLN